jgi:vacuolar protein sorting-associated protein 45
MLPSGYLESLADIDVLSRIRQVHEYYADYFAVSPSLFHADADLERAGRAFGRKSSSYASREAFVYERDFATCLSAMLALKKRPEVRYALGSEQAKRLAHDLVATMRDEQDLFTFALPAGEAPPLLLILDRRDDVITPLLTQWTYQSMVHELLGIRHNRIVLKGDDPNAQDNANNPNAAAPAPAATSSSDPLASGGASKSAEQKRLDALRDVVLSVEQDDFFRRSAFVNFGELGLRIKRLVADFQASTRTATRLESIDDMRAFMDNYPQFRQQSGTVSKHVGVMGEISKVRRRPNSMQCNAMRAKLIAVSQRARAGLLCV